MFKLSISAAALLLLAAPAVAKDAKCGASSRDAAMTHEKPTAMFAKKGSDADSGKPACRKDVCALDITDDRDGDDS